MNQTAEKERKRFTASSLFYRRWERQCSVFRSMGILGACFSWVSTLAYLDPEALSHLN